MQPLEKKSRRTHAGDDFKGIAELASTIPVPDPLTLYRAQILRVPSYYIRGDKADVCALVLDNCAEDPFVLRSMHDAIVSLALHAIDLYGNGTYRAGFRRHKAEIVGGQLLRTGCWEDRQAFCVTNAEDEDDVVLYGYLACGTDTSRQIRSPACFKDCLSRWLTVSTHCCCGCRKAHSIATVSLSIHVMRQQMTSRRDQSYAMRGSLALRHIGMLVYLSMPISGHQFPVLLIF